jgi:hypothetical protein
MDGPEVKHKSETLSDTKVSKRRYITMDEANLDTGFPRPLVSEAQGTWNNLDTSDIPSPGRQFDRPDPAAAAKVERKPVRPLAFALLALLAVKQ